MLQPYSSQEDVRNGLCRLEGAVALLSASCHTVLLFLPWRVQWPYLVKAANMLSTKQEGTVALRSRGD